MSGGVSSGLRAHPAADPVLLAGLDARCFPDPWNAAFHAVLAENTANRAWLLHLADGEPAGFLVFRDVADEGEILRIGIVPECRRRGLGAWLLGRLTEEGRRRGWRAIFLEVRAGNRAARGLYEREGYRETGLRWNYYRAPVEDAVICRLILPAGPAG